MKGDAAALFQLFKTGRLDEALALGRKLEKQHPEDPVIPNLLGAILSRLGQRREGIASLRRSVELKPDYADAHANLGKALTDVEDNVAAVASLKRALLLNPRNVEAHNNLGIALNTLGQTAAAIASYQAALTLQPDHVDAKINLALALAETGDHAAAVDLCETALAAKPQYARGHRNFSTLKRFQPGDPHIAQMVSLLRAADPAGADAMQLNFALAKAYEDIGDVDRAFACLERGNHLRKVETGYQIERDRQMFTRIRSIFQDGPLKTANADRKGKRPLFVVGMPRSGTTLVEQILASHSQVYGAGELPHLNALVRPFLREMAKQSCTRWEDDRTASVRTAYMAKLDTLGAREPSITDKMPANFRYIGFIFAAFPEARVINVNRNAIAVGWSLYKHYFPASGMSYSCDLTDIAQYIGLYSELMAFWRGLFPGRILDIDYELLTEDQEAQTCRLLAYCDLDWEDACLAFHNTQRAVQTASSAQVRQAMYTGSSDAWRAFERHLGPLVTAFGR